MAQHQHRCHFDLASIKVQKCINKQISFKRPAKGLWNDSLYIRNPLPAVTIILMVTLNLSISLWGNQIFIT